MAIQTNHEVKCRCGKWNRLMRQGETSEGRLYANCKGKGGCKHHFRAPVDADYPEEMNEIWTYDPVELRNVTEDVADPLRYVTLGTETKAPNVTQNDVQHSQDMDIENGVVLRGQGSRAEDGGSGIDFYKVGNSQSLV